MSTPTERRQGRPPAVPGRAMRIGTGIVLIPAGVLCSLLPLLLSLLFTGVNAAFFGLNTTVAGELLGAPGRRADLNRRSSAPVQP